MVTTIANSGYQKYVQNSQFRKRPISQGKQRFFFWANWVGLKERVGRVRRAAAGIRSCHVSILIFRKIFTDDLPYQGNWTSFNALVQEQGSLELGEH
jgi:hypothetical protein